MPRMLRKKLANMVCTPSAPPHGGGLVQARKHDRDLDGGLIRDHGGLR
jgi:hypothetical protein